MKNHILFHDDIDGIVTAAMFVGSIAHENNTIRLQPVKSSMRGDKFETLMHGLISKHPEDNVVILDYQYHPLCNVWVDHHNGKEFLGLSKEEIVSAYNSKTIIYKKGAKSSARVLYDFFNNTNSISSRRSVYFYDASIGDILNMTDMIDTASYHDVDFVFNSKHPMMILRAYLENIKLSVDNTYSRIVESVHSNSFNFDNVLFSLGIDDSEIYTLRKTAFKISKRMTINVNVSISYCNTLYEFPRYSEYFVNKDLPFSIRVMNLGGGRTLFDVSMNPWSKHSDEVHIGNFLSSLTYPFSGGGHKGVGGAVVNGSDVDQCINEVTNYLNGGESMEKYAVDGCDSVEKKANEIVKQASDEGKSITVDEARKQAVESEGSSDVQGESKQL